MRKRQTDDLEGLILHAADQGIELYFRPDYSADAPGGEKELRTLSVVASRNLGCRVVEARKLIAAEQLRRAKTAGVILLVDAGDAVREVIASLAKGTGPDRSEGEPPVHDND